MKVPRVRPWAALAVVALVGLAFDAAAWGKQEHSARMQAMLEKQLASLQNERAGGYRGTHFIADLRQHLNRFRKCSAAADCVTVPEPGGCRVGQVVRREHLAEAAREVATVIEQQGCPEDTVRITDGHWGCIRNLVTCVDGLCGYNPVDCDTLPGYGAELAEAERKAKEVREEIERQKTQAQAQDRRMREWLRTGR